MEMSVKFPRVVGRKRREQDDVERLETVGCVRWKHSEEDLVGVAKVYKTRRDVAAVAVEDQKSPSPSRTLLREAIKDLGKPGKPEVVVRPS
jgi:hypothetical protein